MTTKKSSKGSNDGEEALNTKAISFLFILKVIRKDTGEEFKELLTQGLNINMVNGKGKTLLMIQCINLSLKGVKLLLEHGSDVNITDSRGNSALILACRHYKANCKEECADIIKLLVAKGTNINMSSRFPPTLRDYYRGTVLLEACIRGRLDVVTLLLELGADINDSYQNPLIEACTLRRINVVRLLISYGADVNGSNNYGNTSLGVACIYGFDDVVKVLLGHGADTNLLQGVNKLTPLVIACMNGHVSTIKLLLDRGADINYICEGRTPLLTACYYGKICVVRYLLQRGADANAYSTTGITPLMAMSGYSCNCPLLDLLLEYGGDINAESGEGGCPLSFAAERYRRENVKLLLERGADLYKEDGITPAIAFTTHGLFTSDPEIAALVVKYSEVNKRAYRALQPLLK